MNTILRLVWLCTGTCVLLSPTLGRADERLAILPMSGTNVHPGYLQAAQEILRDHLSASGRYLVTSLPGEPGSLEATPTAAVEAGRQAGCQWVVASHLTRLQSFARIRVTVYSTMSGAAVFSDSLGTTGGPDQLDPLLKRLATAIATGQRSKDNADIDTVTESEAYPYMKQMATRVFGLKLGLLMPLARPSGRSATADPLLGIFWLYDARSFLGEIFLDLASNSNDVTAFDIGLGGYYPLHKGNMTPYFGGGAAWSVTDFGGGGGAHGLRFHGSAGVLFGRLSSVQVRGEVGYFINAYSEPGSSVITPQGQYVTGDSVVSHGPMVTIGLGL